MSRGGRRHGAPLPRPAGWMALALLACLTALASPLSAKPLLVLWDRETLDRPREAAPSPLETLRTELAKALPDHQVTVLSPRSPQVHRLIESRDLRPDQAFPTEAESAAALGLALGAEWILCPPTPPAPGAEEGAKGAQWLLVHCASGAASPPGGLPESSAISAAVAAAPAAPTKPAQALAWHTRAQQWMKRRHGHEALVYLRRAVDLVPYSLDYRASLGRALLMAGRPDEALEALRQVLREQKDHPGAQLAMAELELARGNAAEALVRAEAVEKAGVEDPELDLLLGKIHYTLGRHRKALEYLDLVRDVPESWRYLALIRFRWGDWSAALGTARRLLQTNPGDLEMRRLAAQSLSESGRPAEAVLERSELVRGLLGQGAPWEDVDRETEAVLSDILSAIERVTTGVGAKGDLYRASQEAVVLADRLQAEAGRGPDQGGAAERRLIAYKLWSQAAYDQLKALESGDLTRLEFPADLIREAVTELHAARRLDRGARGTTSRAAR